MDYQGSDSVMKSRPFLPPIFTTNIMSSSSIHHLYTCTIPFTLVIDSTFVCPTEILAFNSKLPAFREINTDVLACSIDSEYAHLAWSRLAKKSGGLGGPLDLPLLSDVKKELTNKFDVLTDSGVALRYLMIIIHFSPP